MKFIQIITIVALLYSIQASLTLNEVVGCQNMCNSLCTSKKCVEQASKFSKCRGSESEMPESDSPCYDWVDKLSITDRNSPVTQLNQFATCVEGCSNGDDKQYQEYIKCQCACTGNGSCSSELLSFISFVVIALLAFLM